MKFATQLRHFHVAAAALVLLAVVGGMSVYSIRQQREAALMQYHTLEVLRQIEEVRLALLRPEMRRGGYLLTERALPLPRLDDVRTHVDAEIGQLRELMADNPEQQERLGRLQPLVQERLGYFAQTLDPQLTRDHPRQTALTVESRAVGSRIEALLDDMIVHETELLRAREQITERSRSRSLIITSVSSVLAVALLGGASFLLWRELRERMHVQAALQQLNAALDHRVQSQTNKLAQANTELSLEVERSRAAEARVREQAELLDRVHEAIIIVGLDRRVRYWNQGAERLYGTFAAESVGKDIDDLLGRAGVKAEQRAAIAAALHARGEWDGELSQMSPDGKLLVIDSHWSQIADAHGQPRAIVVVNIDVTERVQLQRQFLRAQRIESIGTLAGGIAHDLNNVLTPILMAVKLLQKDRPNMDRKGMLATAQASAERGAEMVKQLLSFAGGVQGERHPLSLKAVVNEVRTLLTHTLPKAIELDIQIAPDMWLVEGDVTQLAQVLMNLCVNARDAMPDGGKLTVQCENAHLDTTVVGIKHPDSAAGPYVCINVTDTGTGIAPEILDKIFDPFFTTKEMGKGTGLGLSTAVGIVKSHGGFVQVYSEVGHGTRVAVYLPATEQTAEVQQRIDHPAPNGAGELILVVDDERPILTTAAGLLAASGYQALTANSGPEAVALFSQHQSRIRAVLLDMMMPGMDGPATMRALQEIDPKVRVVACSGLNTSSRIGDVMTAGAFAFLQKPYSDEALLHTLHQVCQEG